MKKSLLLATVALAALGFGVACSPNTTTPQPGTPKVYTRSEVETEVSTQCSHINQAFVMDYNNCAAPIQRKMLNLEQQPSPDAEWYTSSMEWVCPASRLGTMVPCSVGNVPDQKEIDKVTKFEQCVGRSGKEERSLGWDWAAAQCRENSNAF